MWRHQFMLAGFGLLLVLSGVVSAAAPDDTRVVHLVAVQRQRDPHVSAAAPDDTRVVPQAKNDLPRGMTPHTFLSCRVNKPVSSGSSELP